MSDGRTQLAPVVVDLALSCPVPTAFEVFTGGIGNWWPADFTASGERLAEVILEPGPGGRLYERDTDGRTHDWGTVREWRPGTAVTFSWLLGLDPTQPTEVRVRFSGAPGVGAQVRLEHRGWRPEQETERTKFAHSAGWARVLSHFRTAAESTG